MITGVFINYEIRISLDVESRDIREIVNNIVNFLKGIVLIGNKDIFDDNIDFNYSSDLKILIWLLNFRGYY